MKMIKNILNSILLMLISICGFGGGCLVYTALTIAFFPEIPAVLNKILFLTTMLAPIPLCWYIAPKVADKLFE